MSNFGFFHRPYLGSKSNSTSVQDQVGEPKDAHSSSNRRASGENQVVGSNEECSIEVNAWNSPPLLYRTHKSGTRKKCFHTCWSYFQCCWVRHRAYYRSHAILFRNKPNNEKRKIKFKPNVRRYFTYGTDFSICAKNHRSYEKKKKKIDNVFLITSRAF